VYRSFKSRDLALGRMSLVFFEQSVVYGERLRGQTTSNPLKNSK
jgi:hypothetical protein